jgi:chorismate mutase
MWPAFADLISTKHNQRPVGCVPNTFPNWSYTVELFTGWQYLLIDAANQFGLDKKEFNTRIAWAEENLDQLEVLGEQRTGTWKERPLYFKAVMAIRKALAGIPTGHRASADATASGMQIMSALTGCHPGAWATNLVDPNKRVDAYTECTKLMQKCIAALPDTARADIKDAAMTVLYGSKKRPKEIFGEGTEELNVFHKSMGILCPGAVKLLGELRNAWTPFAKFHTTTLPDGYVARMKVMEEVKSRLEVDELDHATFTYIYYVNEGKEKGLSLIANTIHECDAYILRCVDRRANYDPQLINWASSYIEMLLEQRAAGEHDPIDNTFLNPDFNRLMERYEASQMPDIRILNYAQEFEMRYMSTTHLKQLASMCSMMLQHKPFPVLTIHDDFTAAPNNMNWVRLHYREILAQIAESTMLDDIFTQLLGTKSTYPKESYNLAEKIRKSNYALS